MLSPFELSLEEYEALWKPVPYGQEKDVTRGNIHSGVPDAELSSRFNEFAYVANGLWLAANELRHEYHQTDPEKASYYLAWMLRPNTSSGPQSSENQYAVDIMAGWQRGQDDAQAVRNLLQFAADNRGYTDIEVACLVEAAQICVQHQMPVEARRLCAACFVRSQGYRSHWPLYRRARDLYRELAAQAKAPTSNHIVEQFNPLSPQDTHIVRCLLADLGRDEITDKVLQASQAIIALRVRKTSTNRSVTSRLGGVPDVEECWKWPERLEFLAQLNLEELAPFNINGVLPPRGLLRFFMLNLSYGWEEETGFRVEFYDGDLAALGKAETPDFLTDLRDAPTHAFENVIYCEAQVEAIAAAQISVRQSSWDDQDNFYQEGEIVSYLAHAFETGQEYPHKMLGDASSESFYPSHEEDKDWVLLFSINSTHEIEMMFSDAGTMYFYMKREDLIERRFDRVKVTMTCG